MSKKAWEIACEMTRDAVPVAQMGEDREWVEEKTSIGDIDIEETRVRWIINVPGSRVPDYVFIGGIQATENMGYDVSEAEVMIPAIQEACDTHDDVMTLKLTTKLFEVLGRAPKVEGHSYWNYQCYNRSENHTSKVEFPVYETPEFSEKVLFERLHAGWLAQVTGVALETIIEGYCTDQLRKTFGEIWDYLRVPNTYNNDMLFELAFLETFLLKGRDVTSEDTGLERVGRIEHTWGREEAAFKNMKRGVFPSLSVTIDNSWREWISAQMGEFVCGIVVPGEPALAAKLAWTDDAVPHVNNGVLGEVLSAILVSLAFMEQDMRTLLKKTIDMMPVHGEYHSVAKSVQGVCGHHREREPVWREYEEWCQRYNWIHTYPNAVAEVVSLYFDGNDFEECMHVYTMCGQDVDCNARQIGMIYGIMFGYAGTTEKQTTPLGDKFDSPFRGYEHTTISHLAKIIQKVVRLVMRKK